jgi:hypothetical protein
MPRQRVEIVILVELGVTGADQMTQEHRRVPNSIALPPDKKKKLAAS